MKDAEKFLRWLNGPKGGGSAERPWRVLEFSQKLDDDEGAIFWRVATEEWSGFDLIPHAEFEAQFARFSGYAPGYSGTEPMRLFRGQDADEPVGLSWTACVYVAEGFARGHRGLRSNAPVVLETIADPKQVAFECNDREEREYVMLSRPASYRLAGAR